MPKASNHSENAMLVGASSSIQAVRARINSIGTSSINIQIQGESGVGKEVVARALHIAYGKGAFVPINCAAIPERLLESELFGHRRGAFSGAMADKPGLLEEAHGGTLFLDEIADLPLGLQAKLLRVMDHGETRRLGENRVRYIDFRLLTASHKDLWAEVQSRSFREDLFWRVTGMRLFIPPLRHRLEDIPLLAEHFLGDVRILPEALDVLKTYDWPGNVRQFRSVLLIAKACSNGGPIQRDHLHLLIDPAHHEECPFQVPPQSASLSKVVRWHIDRVLSFCSGNRSQAARILGIDEKTLWRKLRQNRTELRV